MKPDLTHWLGRPITVQIDRPKNSIHPERSSLSYALNYGFVPNTLAGDGEPIDAYVLGVDEPVVTFSYRYSGYRAQERFRGQACCGSSRNGIF